jgi:beta-lactam-binding protein with PASTA domain
VASVVALVVAGGCGSASEQESSGTETSVPELRGKATSGAKALANEAGFDYVLRTRQSCEGENLVVDQDPTPTTMAERGSTITLTVTVGPGGGPCP